MIQILSKNIIGATVTFNNNTKNGTVSVTGTIKKISYPDTIWTTENGYALHYPTNECEHPSDIVSIVKDGKELSVAEILTTSTGFIYGKFEDNYADEFDVEGCRVFLQEEFDNWYEESCINLDKKFKKLSKEEFEAGILYNVEVLKNLSPYEFKKKNPDIEIDQSKLLHYEVKSCNSYSNYLEKFKSRHNDLGKHVVGFGSNEDLRYTSKEEFWKCFNFIPCSEEIYRFVKKHGEIGTFPLPVEY